jgi:hypothetical protein
MSGISAERQRRAERVSLHALRQAGAPFNRWVVLVTDTPAFSTAVVRERGEFLEDAEIAIAMERDPAAAAHQRAMVEEIKQSPESAAEIVFFEDGNAQLSLLTPACPSGDLS